MQQPRQEHALHDDVDHKMQLVALLDHERVKCSVVDREQNADTFQSQEAEQPFDLHPLKASQQLHLLLSSSAPTSV